MKAGLSIFFLFYLLTATGQEVMNLGADEKAGTGSMEQLSWLSGNWAGTGFGGSVEEFWLPSVDNSMLGLFRFSSEGQTHFTEYFTLEKKESTVVLKVKHFNRDFSPWEEKDNWVEFRLIKIEGQTVWFDGLTYSRTQDELIVKLNIQSDSTTRIETIRLQKVKP